MKYFWKVMKEVLDLDEEQRKNLFRKIRQAKVNAEYQLVMRDERREAFKHASVNRYA